MKKHRQRYTQEFKRDAVKLVTDQEYGVTEAARNLGINANMLSRWVQQYRSGEHDAFRGNGRVSPEQEELRRLRAENKRLRLEREVLKKAAAFFANESN